MLAVIGVGSIGDLFRPIPQGLRARSFDLPPGMSEFEMLARLQEMAARNGRIVPFVGGGCYDHVIPAAVDHLAGRAEFYTAYTPYQPECSQGSLQALFEYQSAICRLTGLGASNASLYDGGTALAEAAMMALRVTGRDRVILDGAVNPFHRAIVRTYLGNLPVEIVELPPVNGMLDRQSLAGMLDDRCAAVMVQNPTFFGCVADYSDLAVQVHKWARCWYRPCTRYRWDFSRRRETWGSTSPWATARASETTSPSEDRPSASWPQRSSISGTCPAGSWARPSTAKDAAASS